MLQEVNDSPEQAYAISSNSSKASNSKVNLIPFNPFAGTRYQRSSNNRIHAFRRILEAARIVTTIRKTRGDDIDAACGQLVGQVQDRTKRQARHQARLSRGG